MLDGQPIRLLAGAMHYFRIHPEYWRDRMEKMKLMGLNTLETIVPWNLHEPQPGNFNFEGFADIEAYIKLADELGLHVLVRPGPYICGEWEFGGFPAWLLKYPGMRLRCDYGPYIEAVRRFYTELMGRLRPLQIDQGGPILAMQIENEYGSYGNDKAYLTKLEQTMRELGITVPFFTSDGASDVSLQYGTLPHIFKTANFGSDAPRNFAKLREYQPDKPLMCMEYWNGWFDHWGENHHTRDPEDAAAGLREILEANASVCMYMFHGGTNFGFWNGANCDETYAPTITSYDDDAPLNEQGNVTPKFEAFREVLRDYTQVPDVPLPQVAPTLSLPAFEMTETVDLFTALPHLSKPIASATIEPMEQFDQRFGFILYETRVTGPRREAKLILREVHDRAHVFINGALACIVEREYPSEPLQIGVPPEGMTISILVENMGRINYGPQLCDRKGITDCVIFGQHILHGWNVYPLPMDDISDLKFGSDAQSGLPVFYRDTFHVDAPVDTFLLPHGFAKGVAWLNGFNLGRYWKRGPQQTLYVPRPLLKPGENELILFELDGATDATVEFLAEPILDR